MERSSSSVLPACVALIAVVMFFIATPVFGDAPNVKISLVGVQQNAGSADFPLRGGPDPLPQGSSALAGAPIDTSGHRHTIYVDPAVTLDKSNILLFTLYVRSAVASEPIYRYVFVEQPIGRFFDCKVPVLVTVTDNTGAETALVTLPLHSMDMTIDFISSDDRAPAQPIDATSATSVDIAITNKLSDLDVVLNSVSVSLDHDEKWSKPAILSPTFDPANPPRINPGHSIILKVIITPSFWKAVMNSVLPTTESQADDTLRLKLSYASDSGGISRPFEVTRSLRFVNWPGAVLFALVGAILGCVVVYFSGAPQKGNSLGRILLSRCSSAIILIGVGIFLVTSGSKFVLFTLNLDPRQLLAAFIVGGLSGVGLVDLVEFIRGLKKPAADGG
jgi:hypothetical protein